MNRGLGELGDGYLPLRALSGYAGLSVRTLRGYLHDPGGPLPHYRVGGKILVRRSDYDAWVRRFKATSGATLDHVVADILETLI